MPKTNVSKPGSRKAPAPKLGKPGKPGNAAPVALTAPVAASTPADLMAQLQAMLSGGNVNAANVPPAPASAPKIGAPKLGKPGAVVAPGKPGAADPEKEALRTEIAGLKTQIAGLAKAAAKAQGPAPRTEAEITEGAEAHVTEDDWRLPYHGVTVYCRPFDRKPGHGNPINVREGASMPRLLSIPRDSDGPWGAEARARGEIASHFRKGEDGSYIGEPEYLNQAELAAVWDDEMNG